MAFPWASVPGWVISAFGPAVKKWLDDKATRRAFDRAVSGTFHAFQASHPEWRDALFDQWFLEHKAAPLLASFLERRGEMPDEADLAAAWKSQFSTPITEANVAEAARAFLTEFQQHLTVEKALWGLLDRLAWDTTAMETARTARGVTALADQQHRAEISDALDGLLLAAECYAEAVDRLNSGDVASIADLLLRARVARENGERRLYRLRYIALDQFVADFKELVLAPFEAAMDALRESSPDAPAAVQNMAAGLEEWKLVLREAP